MRALRVAVPLVSAACRSREEPTRVDAAVAIVDASVASASPVVAASTSPRVASASPEPARPSPPPDPASCPRSTAWDAIAPADVLGKHAASGARLFELRKAGAPAGYAWVRGASDENDGCAPPPCVVLGKRIASIDGPIADVGASPIDTKGAHVEVWDAPQGPCSLHYSVTTLRDASGATRSAVVDAARLTTRAPETATIFPSGVAIVQRSIADGMDPWGGLTETNVWTLEDGALRDVLHVPNNASHTCWPNEKKCKQAIFDLTVVEPGAAPLVELASEVGATDGATSDTKLVNVEIGRYRWDLDTRRFKAQGKPRHAMRPMQMGPFPPK